ncbi:MAG TPA: GNAT family N-acetyltransferase [Actinomycetaceae bacterium]|nr:GNAT family N-acetyltransferase [Actinomycetaceae bacterium]
MAQEPVVIRNEVASRFELRLDGEVIGITEYSDDEDAKVREFVHTELDPQFSGRGLAGRLVGTALKQTRDDGYRISPVCPYVAGYVRRHPEYQEVLA